MQMGSFMYWGLALLLFYMIEKLLVLVWWKPAEIQKHFRKQGIHGLLYRPVLGSLVELAKIYGQDRGAPAPQLPFQTHPCHCFLQSVFPHLLIWRENYGSVYFYWYGHSPRLSITDPDLIKEMTMNPRRYAQSIQHPVVHLLLGKSVIAMGGETWATQRRLLNPFFLMESLKGLSGIVIREMEERIERWTGLMESNKLEIEVHKEFENLAQCIVAQVIFGNDAEEGLPIVQLQSQQSALSSQAVRTYYIPGSRFLPTFFNRRSKWLRQDAERRFGELIDRRERREGQTRKDWLSLMLSLKTMSRQQIIDECCTIAIAGSESTNLLLAWACVLLGVHTDWQHRAREEVHHVLKGSRPTTEGLGRLKILNMIINEILRLYPPIPFVMKKTVEETKIGNLIIPAGVDVEVPLIAVHHDRNQWGDDVYQFNPGRFAEGISKASKHPMAFMPFMQGPRICIGMNFAMIEAKIVLTMILQNFTLVISPTYKHEPVCGITLKPGKGAHVMFHKI